MKNSFLEIRNVVKYYGRGSVVTKALDGVSFTMERGEFTAIMGASGSGKSTLLNVISTIDTISSGEIILDGIRVADQKEEQLSAFRRDKLGFVFQEYNLLDTLTVGENIMLPLNLQKISAAETKSRLHRVAEELGVEDQLDKFPYELSGGQRQRVGIAQALLGDPEILVLDEPTAGLDPEERIRFRGIISDLSQQKLVLLSTHIVSDLEAVANEIILLRKGVVLEMQKPASLLEQLNGQVWLVTVPAVDEAALTKQYTCSNVMHTDGKSVIRLLSESVPRPDAVPTAPNMEDLYLYYFGR